MGQYAGGRPCDAAIAEPLAALYTLHYTGSAVNAAVPVTTHSHVQQYLTASDYGGSMNQGILLIYMRMVRIPTIKNIGSIDGGQQAGRAGMCGPAAYVHAHSGSSFGAVGSPSLSAPSSKPSCMQF